MPTITAPFIRSPKSVRRAALAAAGLIAAAAVITTISVTQLAAADQPEHRETAILKANGGQTPRLGAYSEVLEARAAHAAEVAAVRAAEAARLATPAGAQETARAMAVAQYGWGDDQFGCLVSLWTRESGWNVNAFNASSGAAGIPQALPGEKMAIAGADWQTNPATQIAWGLGYISSAYGTPCSAWNHSEGYNWY